MLQSRSNSERTCFWIGIAVVIGYLLSSLWIGWQRLGWYDEVLTFLIARVPDGATFRAALNGAASALPPGHFLIARVFAYVFGPSGGAMRIPSALSLALGLLVTFECARRASDNLHGLAAIALLTSSVLPYYGYEARPYAPCFLLMAIGLWLWNHPASGKWLVAALFGMTFLAAFSVHYYSALGLVPYGLFEMSQWKGRPRWPSGKLVAGGAGVVCGVVVWLPHIREARKFSADFWSPPSIEALRGVFTEFFPYGLLVAASVLIWMACLVPLPKATVFPMLPVERLGWLFLSLPLVGYVIAKLVTNAYYNRYFIGMLPGVAIAFACALWRRFGKTPRVSAGIVAILLVLSFGKQIKVTAQPWTIEPPSNREGPAVLRAMLAREPDLLRDGKTAIVMPADSTLGVEAHYYSKHPEVYAFLLDENQGPLRRAHLNMARFIPMRFWSFEYLHARAADVALVDPADDTLRMLRESGFQIRVVNAAAPKIIYLNYVR